MNKEQTPEVCDTRDDRYRDIAPSKTLPSHNEKDRDIGDWVIGDWVIENWSFRRLFPLLRKEKGWG